MNAIKTITEIFHEYLNTCNIATSFMESISHILGSAMLLKIFSSYFGGSYLKEIVLSYVL